MPIDHDEQKAYWGQIPKGGSIAFFNKKNNVAKEKRL